MLIVAWLRGLIAHRRARVLATAAGVAVGVGLLASIGTFLSATTSQMTQRAIGEVTVDWQVEAQRGADPAAVLRETQHHAGVARALPVRLAATSGLSASVGGTTQQTGPGRVLGLPDRYAQTFPGEIRVLAGTGTGVLLYQQTAANLHVKPGDQITIAGAGTVRVDGIVDLPTIDSLFQRVGAPAGAQPQAPPDNVVLLPQRQFDAIEHAAVVTQVHVRLDHRLPASPSAAFAQVSGSARNLETQLAGGGLVGDNLGTALDSARQDALYAELLFLFLGLPGAILAGLVTVTIAGAAHERRRNDAALLRTRGATTRQLVGLALGETLLSGTLGLAVGLAAALLVGSIAFGTASFGASTASALLWACGSALAGLLIAGAAITVPAWRDARSLTVARQRAPVGRRDRRPWWARAGLDVIALALAGLVFWQVSRTGYNLVLAPEGLPQVSVNWYALLAPVLGWLGLGLLAYRLADLALARRGLARALRPLAGELAPTVAATMGRQRRLLATAVTLVALCAGFAGSTAVFNATYQQQAEADARLTNGADVTVTESPGAHVAPGAAATLLRVPGVRSVEPLQHRFAYVGSDLQDLYGVRPATIGAAGKLQNGWFANGTASELMRALATRPDGVLVSAETVTDFQLVKGDLLRLRVNGRTIPFHYVGVVKEFPTAPRDSFLVANASYLTRATGSDAVGAFLVQAGDPAGVAARIRRQIGTTAQVTDIVDQRRIVGSNLTAVELSGLTRVELGFALVLAVAASGLALAIGFAERRRTFALAAALGARRHQLGAFVWSESVFVTLGGLVLGTVIAIAISALLIKVLTGVFDPPPDTASVPWLYLGGLLALTLAGTAVAGAVTLRALTRAAYAQLREP